MTYSENGSDHLRTRIWKDVFEIQPSLLTDHTSIALEGLDRSCVSSPRHASDKGSELDLYLLRLYKWSGIVFLQHSILTIVSWTYKRLRSSAQAVRLASNSSFELTKPF